MNLGDSFNLLAEGKGKIKYYLRDGKKEYITDIYYVTNMKSNILRFEQLLKEGYMISMEDNSLTLRDGCGRNVA